MTLRPSFRAVSIFILLTVVIQQCSFTDANPTPEVRAEEAKPDEAALNDEEILMSNILYDNGGYYLAPTSQSMMSFILSASDHAKKSFCMGYIFATEYLLINGEHNGAGGYYGSGSSESGSQDYSNEGGYGGGYRPGSGNQGHGNGGGYGGGNRPGSGNQGYGHGGGYGGGNRPGPGNQGYGNGGGYGGGNRPGPGNQGHGNGGGYGGGNRPGPGNQGYSNGGGYGGGNMPGSGNQGYGNGGGYGGGNMPGPGNQGYGNGGGYGGGNRPGPGNQGHGNGGGYGGGNRPGPGNQGHGNGGGYGGGNMPGSGNQGYGNGGGYGGGNMPGPGNQAYGNGGGYGGGNRPGNFQPYPDYNGNSYNRPGHQNSKHPSNGGGSRPNRVGAKPTFISLMKSFLEQARGDIENDPSTELTTGSVNNDPILRKHYDEMAKESGKSSAQNLIRIPMTDYCYEYLGDYEN